MTLTENGDGGAPACRGSRLSVVSACEGGCYGCGGSRWLRRMGRRRRGRCSSEGVTRFCGLPPASFDGAVLRLQTNGEQGIRRCATLRGNERIKKERLRVTRMTGSDEVRCGSGGAPARNSVGLEAWNGEGCGGTERGRRGLFIGIREEGNRGHKGRDWRGRRRSPP